MRESQRTTHPRYNLLTGLKWTFILLKGSDTFSTTKSTNINIIYIKLTQFKDDNNRRLPWKYYLLRCCGFWEMSETISHTNYFHLSWLLTGTQDISKLGRPQTGTRYFRWQSASVTGDSVPWRFFTHIANSVRTTSDRALLTSSFTPWLGDRISKG